MYILLLSGGSGKRLWPLSNDLNSKQFLRILEDPSGKKQSMIERVFLQLQEIKLAERTLISTTKSQLDAIEHQLGPDVAVICEPSRRDTFPAIMLATSYLAENIDSTETIVIMPVDSYVDMSFFERFSLLDTAVQSHPDALHLMGVEPLHPTSKYGYIIPETANQMARVKKFQEKPTIILAEQLIKENALWSCGVFACQLDFLIKQLFAQNVPTTYCDLLRSYDSLEKTSFDYAVVEKTELIYVHRYEGPWKDLGTWNTLTEEMPSVLHGNAHLLKSTNTHIVNELQIPVLGIGLDDLIVSVSPDGVLVSSKEETTHLKEYLVHQDRPPQFEWKRWGYATILHQQLLEDGRYAITRRLHIKANHQISHHYHEHTASTWSILKGRAEAIIDGKHQTLEAPSVVHIPQGVSHTLRTVNDLIMIEIKHSVDWTEEDNYPFPTSFPTQD
ncbi:sugar phosphate nucleotidyltransferase [Exiguobacterium sp. H66]|uniref:sugar phosphate nucleotidyltransferase n=1 Tax=Exiguobacterium sp. H66 TaxID=2751208 RepID=UPI001BE640A7|nr:sugar phosphate nucleotidyltransferase [Exiguobacterium sp. H66]